MSPGKMLFVGPLWAGSTALQRCRAFEQIGVRVIALDSMERVGRASIVDRIRHRLRWPADKSNLNERLRCAVIEHGPSIVFIDSTRVLARSTIRAIRENHAATVSFYSPDDVGQPHNSSRQLASCDREWDVFFTTKTFNVPELRARNVRNPVLIGKSFDQEIHRPMSPDEVGSDYERYDVVFAGTPEEPRLRSLNFLAEAGIRVIVFGSFRRADLHPSIELRPNHYALDYTRSLHTGKIGLCFLRRLNRDRVTQRSVELPAAGRPMIAEKTDEHDQMFVDGSEYLGFDDDTQLLARVRSLLADDSARLRMAAAGRARCISSGYSASDRARTMLRVLLASRLNATTTQDV